MTADKPVRRYMARVEYLACREEIDSMLARGFSRKLIHEELIKSGRCTMKYNTFCEFIAAAEKPPPDPSPKETEHQPAPPVRPQRQPGIIKSGPEPFPDPKKIDPKTLI